MIPQKVNKSNSLNDSFTPVNILGHELHIKSKFRRHFIYLGYKI